MIAVVQRVQKASVKVDEKTVSSIKKGLLVLAGIEKDDEKSDMDYIIKKITELRLFEDGEHKMNLSVKDIDGELLVVSQFTLAGNVHKGRRPSFDRSMRPETAEKMFNEFVEDLLEVHPKVLTGVFGAKMDVELINDGPVTFMIDSKKRV
jgi:D-tyrosyl-tRNA(Tyr) deacylase